MSTLLRFDCPVTFKAASGDDDPDPKGARCSLMAYGGARDEYRWIR